MATKNNLREILYKLNWTKILNDAIIRRKTSWNNEPVREWHNAADEICTSVIFALEDKGILNDHFREIKESLLLREEILKKDKEIAELNKLLGQLRIGISGLKEGNENLKNII